MSEQQQTSKRAKANGAHNEPTPLMDEQQGPELAACRMI
jgi:hypothetical protein